MAATIGLQAADSVSCWPLACGAAKHVGSHAALNIGQLKAVPLVRAGSSTGRREESSGCGILPWLLGYCTEESQHEAEGSSPPSSDHDENMSDSEDSDDEDATNENVETKDDIVSDSADNKVSSRPKNVASSEGDDSTEHEEREDEEDRPW